MTKLLYKKCEATPLFEKFPCNAALIDCSQALEDAYDEGASFQKTEYYKHKCPLYDNMLLLERHKELCSLLDQKNKLIQNCLPKIFIGTLIPKEISIRENGIYTFRRHYYRPCLTLLKYKINKNKNTIKTQIDNDKKYELLIDMLEFIRPWDSIPSGHFPIVSLNKDFSFIAEKNSRYYPKNGFSLNFNFCIFNTIYMNVHQSYRSIVLGEYQSSTIHYNFYNNNLYKTILELFKDEINDSILNITDTVQDMIDQTRKDILELSNLFKIQLVLNMIKG